MSEAVTGEACTVCDSPVCQLQLRIPRFHVRTIMNTVSRVNRN